MKLLKYTIALSAISGSAHAQGLFDVNPNEIESESSPLRYTAGISLGYDENANPTSGQAEESTAYVKAHLGANVVVRDARTAWDLNAVISQTNNFDVNTNEDSTSARLALNLNHKISDRLRVVSRNFFNYGLDLGNFFGSITDRQQDDFTYFSTDQAIGYRWTDRLATYTGIGYSSLNFSARNNDVDSFALYNSFRYSLAPNTILTAGYRYTRSKFEVGGRDRNSQVISAGFESKVSDTATFVVDAGVQISSETAPYAQITYVNVINDQLKMRAFARYSIEDTNTTFLGGRFDDTQAFRIGFAADYTLSPSVVLTTGGNYVVTDLEQGSSAALTDSETDLFNAYAALSFRLNQAVSLRTSVNYTTSDSEGVIPNRDYDRLRYEIGVNYTF